MNYKMYSISDNVVIANKKMKKKPKIGTFTTIELFNPQKGQKIEALFQVVGILNNIVFVSFATFDNVLKDMENHKEVDNV